MGGRIWVRSEAGAGASFHFTLPTEAAPNVSLTAVEGSPFDDTLAQRWPMRILVAEDNEVNKMVAKAMLRRFGYDADMAGNGREARRHGRLLAKPVSPTELRALLEKWGARA